ncbi:MAG: sigma-70 family RNA polymerase sigma factor [Prevotellaceae bacterium]|nr:sigma-70 family RNA polymerase sigma factor [Prevotella sp.]MDD7529361.1 sigma-70 family RNA polymerase sigma factor [Prevotellaceae bacterium]MDY2634011.1 sigma-70 family RNA polymerase sigma factor [Prevotella sp.]
MKKIHEMTDEELALAYIDGNNRAFDLLLERNQSRLFSYILFVVRRHDVANDLFQETFVKIITKLQENKYTDSGKFRAWMMRIAHNVIMDWFRTKKNDRIVEPSETNDLSNISSRHLLESNIEDFYVNEQVLADVKRMMELLPDTQREVAYMRFYQCLSFKEIAETTGVSINTALGRMRYAILNMRRMAKENGVVLQTD